MQLEVNKAECEWIQNWVTEALNLFEAREDSQFAPCIELFKGLKKKVEIEIISEKYI